MTSRGLAPMPSCCFRPRSPFPACRNRVCRCLAVSFFFQAEDGIRDRDVTGVQTCALPIWTKRSRNERFTRYWDAMFKRELRRQRAVVYIARPLENIPRLVQTGKGRREYYLALLEQLQTEYEHTHRLLLEIFANTGTRIVPMTDLDHFRHYLRFLNPSLDDRFDYDFTAGFEPELSIQENCWHSEGNGQSDFGFFMDGHYHSIIVLNSWPSTTYTGDIQV